MNLFLCWQCWQWGWMGLSPVWIASVCHLTTSQWRGLDLVRQVGPMSVSLGCCNTIPQMRVPDSMDVTGEHYAKWNKPGGERKIPYDCIFKWNLINKTNKQNTTRDFEIKNNLSWPVSLSGLSSSLQTKGSLVRFPVRAHAWVASQVPSRGCMRGNHTLMFLSLSLPSFPFSKNK